MSFDRKSYLADTENTFNRSKYLEEEDEDLDRDDTPTVYRGDKSEGNLLRSAAAFGLDIGISEGGRMASAAAGAAAGAKFGAFLGPKGVLIGGTAGYIIGGLAFGGFGSRVRQRIDRPNEEIDEGQVFADSLINLIPGVGAGKSLYKKVLAQGGIGAGISGGAEIAETYYNTGKLPTKEELTRTGLTGFVLGGGLGVSGDVFNRAYEKFAGLPYRNLTAAFKAGDPDAKILVDGDKKLVQEYAKERTDFYNDLYTDIREKHDDELIRFKQFQDKVAGGQYTKKNAPLTVLTDESDFYMNRRMAEASIQGKMKKLEADQKIHAADLKDLSNITGLPATEISKEVDMYLYAKHAIPYNKTHFETFGQKDGASGILTKDAKEIINNFEKKDLNKAFETVIDYRSNLSKSILDTLEYGGLVSKKEAAQLRKTYPDYIPLNRIMDESPIEDTVRTLTDSANVKFEILSKGIKRGKGSERAVDNITSNIVRNYVSAVRRAEINKENQSFVTLIQNNKFLGKDTDKIAKIEPMKPTSFRIIKDTSPEAQRARKQGLKVKPIKMPVYDNRSDVATVFIDGKRFGIEFDDNRLAQTFKGINRKTVEGFMKGSLILNRYLGRVFTSYNPEFLVPNAFRDRSEAIMINLSKMKTSKVAKMLNPAMAMDDFRAIRRYIKNKPGTSEKDIGLDRVMKSFVEDGGSTGNLGRMTIESIDENIAKFSQDFAAGATKKSDKFNKIINDINTYFEDLSRFTTYRLGLESGMTRKQAAFAARNSSFDPLQVGSESANLRAAYLFVNPAIQGGKNFLRSAFKDKKTFAKITGSLLATTYAIDQYNKLKDPQYREKIPQWELNKNLIFVTGTKPSESDPTKTDITYTKIPIGYSLTPFKVMADYTQRFMVGDLIDADPKKVSNVITQNIIDSYNPLGGSLNPTQLRPFNELAQNEDGIGRDIRPDFLDRINMDPREKMYPHTAEKLGGEMALKFADELNHSFNVKVSPENLQYLYQLYLGGPGKTVERLFDVTAKLYNGEKTSKNDWPVIRRFYGESATDVFNQRTGLPKIVSDLEYESNTDSQRSRRIAQGVSDAMQDKTPLEKQNILRENILRNDEFDESAIIRVAEQLQKDAQNMTRPLERLKLLAPEYKSEAILKYLDTVEDDEEKRQFIQDVISKNVLGKTEATRKKNLLELLKQSQ